MQKRCWATARRNGFFQKAALGSILLVAMIVGITGCKDSPPSPENSILGIELLTEAGEKVYVKSEEGWINEEQSTVTLAVRPGEDVSALKPILTLSPGAVLNAEGPEYKNFADTQTFRIQAEDTSIPPRAWTVALTDLTSFASITGVEFKDADGKALWKESILFDDEKRQVTIELPAGTDLTLLIPELSVSEGAKLITEIDTEAGYDFLTSDYTFIVEAQNGTQQTWNVSVTKSSANRIDKIALKNSAGNYILTEAEWFDDQSLILITVAPDTDLTGIEAVLSVSPDAELVEDEAEDEGLDFIQDHIFTVRAQDGTEQIWTVSVIKSSEKSIISGSLERGGVPLIWENVELDSAAKRILITLPKGTDLTGITPKLDLPPGARVDSVIPDEGLDFNDPQTVTIKAQDGSTEDWTIAVVKNSDKDITGIVSLTGVDDVDIPILESEINPFNQTVVLTVPRNTVLSGITLLATTSLDAAIAESLEDLDFTRPVSLTVTAQDGSAVTWTVAIEYDTAPILGLSVEVAGIYDIKFGFSYPNHIEQFVGSPDDDDYTEYDYDIAYNQDGSLNTDNPIKLSYFTTDNDIYNASENRKTYYNTLVVNAPGFTNVKWKIDAQDAPANNSTSPTSSPTDNFILTIRAQDWFLESTHTVYFEGVRNYVKYSGTFEFKVVEQEGN